MFERQWFSCSSQLGLQPKWLELEDLLLTRQAQKCLKSIDRYFQDCPRSEHVFFSRQRQRVLHLCRRQPARNVSIFFHSFWSGFNYYKSIFPYILRDALNYLGDASLVIEIVDNPHACDISIGSCFPPDQPNIKLSLLHSTSVLYLGENVRPNYGDYDYSFSTDLNTYAGRNSYLPVTLSSLYDCAETEHLIEPASVSNRLSQLYTTFSESHLPWSSRDQAVVFVGNNYEPKRTWLLSMLGKLGIRCSQYGSHSRPIHSKHDLYGKHRFIMCPENSFGHGYITEKFLHGIMSGGKLLHWGYVPDRLRSLAGDRIISVNDDNLYSVFTNISMAHPPSSSLPDVLDLFSTMSENQYVSCVKHMSKIISLYM